MKTDYQTCFVVKSDCKPQNGVPFAFFSPIPALTLNKLANVAPRAKSASWRTDSRSCRTPFPKKRFTARLQAVTNSLQLPPNLAERKLYILGPEIAVSSLFWGVICTTK